MEIDANPRQADWDGFMAAQPHTPFLQSWAWGEFQQNLGRPVERFLLVAGNREPVAGLQAIVQTYPLGFRSVYVPHGPVFSSTAAVSNQAGLRALIDSLTAFAKTANAVFVRIELQQKVEFTGLLRVRLVTPVQPGATRLLDLSPDDDALLNGMHPKTRYNIRLAERQGVVVESGNEGLLDDFLLLLADTERREGVRFFGAEYFRKLFQTPTCRIRLKLYRARFQQQTLASILVFAFGDTMVYLHGGSSREERQRMAPYLIQWTAIRDARRAGFKWYDFRGVASPDAAPTHPWAGFSRFKRGFGGFDVIYPGAYDWVRRPGWYSLYRMTQRIRS